MCAETIIIFYTLQFTYSIEYNADATTEKVEISEENVLRSLIKQEISINLHQPSRYTFVHFLLSHHYRQGYGNRITIPECIWWAFNSVNNFSEFSLLLFKQNGSMTYIILHVLSLLIDTFTFRVFLFCPKWLTWTTFVCTCADDRDLNRTRFKHSYLLGS